MRPALPLSGLRRCCKEEEVKRDALRTFKRK